MSMSVQQTMEVVTIKPRALITRAASHVHVFLATQEMALAVTVI